MAKGHASSSSASSSTLMTTLNTGHTMPLVGLGTWQAARGVVGRAVADALVGVCVCHAMSDKL